MPEEREREKEGEALSQAYFSSPGKPTFDGDGFRARQEVKEELVCLNEDVCVAVLDGLVPPPAL